MLNKIRMGVIGTNNIALNIHIPGIIKSVDAQLTAICDINESSLKDVGDRYSIPETMRFKSYGDLLSCVDVDAVSICTPNASHYDIAMEAVRNNKPFLLEKPITLNKTDALKLKLFTKKMETLNMIGFSYRYKSAARYARYLIKSGKIGTIHHIYAQYLQNWGNSQEAPLTWRYQKELAGSGVAGDLGIHLIDLTQFLFGDFEKVIADAGTIIHKRIISGTDKIGDVTVDDYCSFLARIQGGISASFITSRFAYGRGNYQRIEIYGNKGGLIYCMDEPEDYILVCSAELYGDSKIFHRVEIPESFNSDQMQSFFDIINDKGDGLSATMEDGYRSQVVLDSVTKSFENEEWVIVG